MLERSTSINGTDYFGEFVPESQFGIWFLSTETWAIHVLARALADLERLIPDRRRSYPIIVDIGCGWGRSFALLRERFAAEHLIGIDIDREMLKQAAEEAGKRRLSVDLRHGSGSQLPVATGSADMIFCHQTFHHIVDQHRAIREFHRVLKPGGILLFAESTRKYIHSWLIRTLFRHPMDVQKSAPEYLELIREAGFEVPETAISLPYLWWSRGDLGLAERLLGVKPPAGREETLINLVATRV